MPNPMKKFSPVMLPLATAVAAEQAAIDHATELSIPYTVCVLDGGARLIRLTRMDGAALAAIDTSIAKARTAVLFAAATVDLAGSVQPGAPEFTIATATSEILAFVGGGVPVLSEDGVVIGAIGAGGGTPEQDNDVATVGAAAAKTSQRS